MLARRRVTSQAWMQHKRAQAALGQGMRMAAVLASDQ